MGEGGGELGGSSRSSMGRWMDIDQEQFWSFYDDGWTTAELSDHFRVRDSAQTHELARSVIYMCAIISACLLAPPWSLPVGAVCGALWSPADRGGGGVSMFPARATALRHPTTLVA